MNMKFNKAIKIISLVFLVICIAISTGCGKREKKKIAPLFDNLGFFDFKITTKSRLAQQYFDQGLVLYYAFEDVEAIRSFDAAISADPECAMCYWGLALAMESSRKGAITTKDGEVAIRAIKKAQQ